MISRIKNFIIDSYLFMFFSFVLVSLIMITSYEYQQLYYKMEKVYQRQISDLENKIEFYRNKLLKGENNE